MLKEKLKNMKKGENMIKIMICPKNQGLVNVNQNLLAERRDRGMTGN